MASQKITQLGANLKQQLIEQPQYRMAEQWYNTKSSQDQLIIKIIGWLILLSVVFLLVIKPGFDAQNKAQSRLDSAVSLHKWLKEKGPLLKQPGARTSGGSILSKVSSSAKQMGIDLKRFEPSSEGGLRIWLDNIAFDRAIEWIAVLNSQGIQISQINTERQQATGYVNLRADLKS